MEIEELLKLSVEKKASDLHIIPLLQPLMRIDGILLPADSTSPKISAEESKRLVYHLLNDLQIQEFEKNRVVELAVVIPEVGGFRVSVYHQLNGVAAVFRIIPKKIPGFEELELPAVLKPLLNLSYGLILVTGPTGSGKSTTLAAMIEEINSFRNCNIITIEDPIEFVYESKHSVFSQLQVGRDTLDFASALRSSLRQDPNVILIGELRDLETMRLALTAAETGHLVMATMHASSAPLAVSRFADVFPAEERSQVRTLLSESLQAVICQTLVKKISGGRTGVYEIMLATPSIRHFIRQDMVAHIESAMQMGGEKGMCTMEQYLDKLVERRVINSLIASNVMASRGSASKNGEEGTTSSGSGTSTTSSSRNTKLLK